MGDSLHEWLIRHISSVERRPIGRPTVIVQYFLTKLFSIFGFNIPESLPSAASLSSILIDVNKVKSTRL